MSASTESSASLTVARDLLMRAEFLADSVLIVAQLRHYLSDGRAGGALYGCQSPSGLGCDFVQPLLALIVRDHHTANPESNIAGCAAPIRHSQLSKLWATLAKSINGCASSAVNLPEPINALT